MPEHTTTFDTRTPIWLGKRCRIRPFRLSDAEAFHQWVRLPEVSLYMNWQPHKDLAESQAYIQQVCDGQDDDINSPWAIVTRDTDICCGFVGFSYFSPDHLRSDFAVALNPLYAGQGIAHEACTFLLSHARALGLIRVQAVVEVPNETSARLMQRLGGVQEARLARYIVSKSGIADAYLYAFLL